MACKDCPKEGDPNAPPQLVVGFRIWYVDGTIATGTTRADWEQLPDDGVLIVMLYYNRFDTGGDSRYRRVLMSNDHFWHAPGTMDAIFGQSDDAPHVITAKYEQAHVKRGKWTDDAHYKTVVAAAMANYNVSDFGIVPVAGTLDT